MVKEKHPLAKLTVFYLLKRGAIHQKLLEKGSDIEYLWKM
jgi:hypothetical protein